MATRTPSTIRTSEKQTSQLIEPYTRSLAGVMAVLVVHFSSQKRVDTVSGEDAYGKYLAAASSVIAAHGGTGIQSTGDAIQACFQDSKDAVKAAIAMHLMGEGLNQEKDPQDRLHMKAGIDYGEVIHNGDDIDGSAVDMARLLKNISGPDEICVSPQVFNLVRDIPSVHFEIVNTWNKRNIPDGLDIYRIVWDAAHETAPPTRPVLCFRPVWKMRDQAFTDAWDDLLKTGGTLWKDQHSDEFILEDKSIIIMPRSIEAVIPLSLAVSDLLRKRMGGLAGSLIPIRIIADVGPYGNGWKADTDNIPSLWEKMNPGYLYVSEDAFHQIQRKDDIQGSPIHRSYGKQSFYQISLERELPSRERKHFVYQKALVQGNFLPCYYCGDKKHQPVDCPSKNMSETTNALDKLGYLCISELNNSYYLYISGEDSNKEGQARRNVGSEESFGLAETGFFELKKVFQLRFFRSFWNAAREEWNKIRKTHNQSEGGLIWLAQDSLRVSELVKAESILARAIDRYPLDYRVYIAAGFLNIDRNDLPKADHYFNEALATAKTDVQKVYALLLQSRIYQVTGSMGKAYDKIQRALSLNVDSVDVIYQDIVLKFLHGKERLACQRLSKLIQEDRTYFVTALIDPDLAPFNGLVEETLDTIFDRIKKEAHSAITDANNEYDLSRVALGKSALDEIHVLRSQIDQKTATDSYFGFLDIIDHCNSIISTCRSGTIHRKREIWEIIQELNKRLEKNMRFVESYPYKGMVRSCREQLVRALDRIRHVQNIGPALSQEQLIACHNLRNDLMEEWNGIESRLKRLDFFTKLCKGSFRFVKWSGIFMGIVWFLDLFLFPLIIYYLNAFLSGFDVSTIPNVWFYQKNFLLFGSLVGMTISLFITIKCFLKE